MDAERGERRRRGLSHRERRVPQRLEQRVGRRGDLGRARVRAGDREYLPEHRERAPPCILRVVAARTKHAREARSSARARRLIRLSRDERGGERRESQSRRPARRVFQQRQQPLEQRSLLRSPPAVFTDERGAYDRRGEFLRDGALRPERGRQRRRRRRPQRPPRLPVAAAVARGQTKLPDEQAGGDERVRERLTRASIFGRGCDGGRVQPPRQANRSDVFVLLPAVAPAVPIPRRTDDPVQPTLHREQWRPVLPRAGQRGRPRLRVTAGRDAFDASRRLPRGESRRRARHRPPPSHRVRHRL